MRKAGSVSPSNHHFWARLFLAFFSRSDFTNFTDEPLSQSTPPPVVPIPQFDTQGGTRTLESVELRSHIDVDSTVSGSLTNRSADAVTYGATVTNASPTPSRVRSAAAISPSSIR